MSERSLLETRDVKRWYDNLAEGSPKTAEAYLWWLGDYCSRVKKVPVEVISDFTIDRKAAQDALEDYIRSLKARISPYDGKPLKPKTIHSALCAVKSWLRYNECEVTREIKIANVKTAPTVEDEQAPSTEELNTILDHANQRTRTAIVMIAYGGIRPEAISRLRLKDLPELEINGRVEAKKVPMQVKVRGELSKNKRPYFTFLVKRGVDDTLEGEHSMLSVGTAIWPGKLSPPKMDITCVIPKKPPHYKTRLKQGTPMEPSFGELRKRTLDA